MSVHLAPADHRRPGGPLRRVARRWPEWSIPAAAVWSLGYAALGLLWWLGVPGFPFGDGDLPDAREESLLGAVTRENAAPWIALTAAAGAVAALVMMRVRARGVARAVLLGWSWASAVLLIVLVPDGRILTTVAYTPIALVGIPLGWPDISYAEFLEVAYPWTTLNLMLCALGGLFWASAALSFHRRTSGACRQCGRRSGRVAAWAAPAAVARWGRWAAYTAAVIPFTYAAVRWAWALGVPLTISDEFLDELHDSGMVWAGAYLATFGALGGILTLGLVQRWGVIWPRWVPRLAGRRVPPAFPVTFAGIVTVSLASAGAVMVRLSDWSRPQELISNPMVLWPLWAVALGTATLAYHLRTRGPCAACAGDAGGVATGTSPR